MHTASWSRSHLWLAGIFLVLVLVPSFFLGYFSLRAVEDERRARQGRVLENYRRYAAFAARAVHQELTELESSWLEFVPGRSGWEERRAEFAAGLDSAALAERYVGAAWLLSANGGVLYPRSTAALGRAIPAPTPAEARLFEDLVARGEAAEFDGGDVQRAIAAYAEILSRVRNPRLLAIAHVDLGRAYLRAGQWDAALAEGRRVLADFPTALDLDNQPLRFLARLQMARALEEKQDAAGAVAVLLDLESDLEQHSDELASGPYDFFVERLDENLARLRRALPPEPARALEARRAALGARAKKPAGDGVWVRKLERKLVRAVMDEQAYSPRLRYVSDVLDDRPYLLAYVFLPDRSAMRVGGLLGLRIDLPRLTTALLPEILRELELSEEAWLEIVDENGNRVIGSGPAGAGAPLVASNVGEPFEFWNVTVHSRAPAATLRAVQFRTKVFLSLILVLLVTIVAGAVLVFVGLRRESRLANLKTSFVSNVSHELRTPLTSIRMYAEMLEMAGTQLPEAERRRQLAVIVGECGRLERLIDAVLDFASLTRGTKRFHFEFEEVGELVRGVAAGFRDQAESQGFSYEVEIEPDLPELRLDADAMRQVLLNLLSNAVKYSDQERWIALRAFRSGAEVALQVEDHGIGIDPAEQRRIFDDFYRVDQRLSSARQGVGLGLTLVRRIVAAHRGRVTVESARGRGARFTVWLPVEPAEAGSAPRPGGPVPLEV